ncbi:hypothetical protein D3C76_1616360 [compost metagenome]
MAIDRRQSVGLILCFFLGFVISQPNGLAFLVAGIQAVKLRRFIAFDHVNAFLVRICSNSHDLSFTRPITRQFVAQRLPTGDAKQAPKTCL